MKRGPAPFCLKHWIIDQPFFDSSLGDSDSKLRGPQLSLVGKKKGLAVNDLRLGNSGLQVAGLQSYLVRVGGRGLKKDGLVPIVGGGDRGWLITD